MDWNLTECAVTSALTMRAPSGEAVELRALKCAMTGSDAQGLTAFILSFQVSAGDYEGIDRQELFGLARSRRGPQFGNGFSSERPIFIEARLRSEHRSRLTGAEVEDVLDMAAVLISSPAEGPLRATESWQATQVTQEIVPGLQGGYEMTG